MAANSGRGQLNREDNYIRPFAPEKLVSRDGFDRPASAFPFLILGLNLVLTRRIPPDFRGGVYFFLYRQTPSGQSRVNRVAQ